MKIKDSEVQNRPPNLYAIKERKPSSFVAAEVEKKIAI